jgi:putative endonuclease
VVPEALKRLVGRRPEAAGEELAARYLERSGLAILDRNYRCRSGEIDIVARERDVTVFVEVKERRGPRYGAGYEAVTLGKRRRIVRAARLYAASRGLGESPLRFDVVSIDWRKGEGPVIRHDRGAFDADGR